MSKEVFKKLFEFRKIVGKVVKSANNPFHKTKYADLNSVIEATDPVLEEVGLVMYDRVDGDSLLSTLADPESGEYIQSEIPLKLMKQDMQQLGSAITYARRYSRMTLLGLQAIDDDGGTASNQRFATQKQVKYINSLILETRTETQRFLGHFGVQAVKDLPTDVAEQAIKTLELKKQKAVKDEK